MAEITRDRAREIISEIYSQSGGFLGDNPREKALGDVLGANVLEAAAKACTSDTRFFYELIQNADDCSYTWVRAQKQNPVLHFLFQPGRIVVQSNEDGFEERHVRALCSAEKSTKTGQIGEKGIGFKSLFKVAWKVRIQSGPFCFSLQHREGQNGLGMIAPISEEHELLPNAARTQFTLFLIDPDQYQTFGDKLLDFPTTMTAFLRKVKMLTVWHRDVRSTLSRVPTNGRIHIELKQGPKVLRSKQFSLFTNQTTGLPPRESRPLHGSAEMTLAFPLASTPLPAVSTAEPFAYAYLPLSAAGEGLNFLLQSDFVVQDNREDLAVCPWNDHLLKELPQVFYAALKELSSMQQFEYSWPQFLPTEDIKHPHWAPFKESVKKDLKHLRIFQTVKSTLKALEEVRYLLPEHCDSKGNPLFGDSEEDIYLSTYYSEYYEILKIYGLQPISPHQLLRRLRRHLSGIGFGSASFGQHLEDDWYSRVASLVLSWMDSPLAKEVEVLRLVPVQQTLIFDATKTLEVFKGPKETDIYFPHDICGNLIPDSVLDTVSVSRAGISPQKQLFTQLGLKHAKQSLVIQRIYDWNASVFLPPSILQSAHNLRYMFLAAPDGSVIDTERILVYDDAGKALVKPLHDSADVYFKTDDKYGMSEICRLVRLHDTTAHGLPSLRVRFLHPSYTTHFPSDAAWANWLEETCAIRRSPRLETSGQPSDILQHIVKCVPDVLIGMLNVHWDIYEKELANASPATISYIKAAVVPTECGKMPLEKSFLGRPDMMEMWSGAYLKDKFPFLSIPSRLPKDNRANWKFLSRFGVTTTLTAEYLLESLSRLSQMSPREHAKSGFFKLYAILADDLFPELWDRVSRLDLVYIPKPGGHDKLVRITDCIWDGPKWSTKYDLAQFDDYSRNPKVKKLFQKVFSKQAPDWEASLLELSRTKHNGVRDSHSPVDIYNYLATGSLTQHDWDTIRDRFKCGEYIHIPDEDTWCTPRECVWSASPFRKWQYGIRHIYPGLEALFLYRLGIYSPCLRDYVDEITSAASGDKTTGQISVLIQELSGFNPTAKDLEHLQLVKFLPVRHGDTGITYISVDDPLLIADDERFEIDSQGPVLDMTPLEVCRSRAFIAAMGLESRYVSRQITELTFPVDDAEESADLTHALREKAGFLYRCTIHYGSPKERAEQLFSEATVYTATGFRRHFSLDDNLSAEVRHEGRVHVSLPYHWLRIYVPRGPKQRAICYAAELPRALVRILEIRDKAACDAFATVLREPVDILDDILSERGVIQVPTTQPKPEALALAIRTKNQVGPGKQLANSASSSGCVKSTRKHTPIKLKATRGYLEKQDSPSSHLTALTRKYSIAADAENLDTTSPKLGCLFSNESQDVAAIDVAIDLAAQSFEPSWMGLLLSRSEIDDHITITDSAFEFAVRNEVCGHDITKRILEYIRLSGQAFAITDTLVEAAVQNEGCGLQIVLILLEYAKYHKSDVTIITEAVLKAAVEDTESDDALVSLLLEQQNTNVAITEDVVVAAAENEYHGYQMVERLLKYDSHIPVSPAVLAAAAGNMQQALDITKLLLKNMGDSTPITEGVIISAIHNYIDGSDMLNLFRQHQGDCLNVTENILIAAIESDDCHKILKLLDLYQDPPITTAVIEAGARNGDCEEEDLDNILALKGSDIQVTEEAMLGAIYNSEKVELLLKYQGRLTEGVLISAASDVDWPLTRAMLDLVLAHGLRITESFLVAAAGNPGHGITVVPLLLEYDKEVRISENIIHAAVTNPGSYADGILQILWDRQPNVYITEETIIAAASTDTSSVLRLLGLINDSPSRSSVQIGEHLLEALSWNRTCGAKALRLLLNGQTRKKEPIPVTEQALVNAAGNSGCGFEVILLLLNHGIRLFENQMTEEVLISAAGNSLWGLEILALLVDRNYSFGHSRKVVNAAEENIWAGEEILAFLVRYMRPDDCAGGCYPSEDEGSTFSGDTEVEDPDVPENTDSSEDGSEEVYETADDE